MPDRKDKADRFGTSDAAFAAAREKHKHIFRTGMYVPTRAEVATMAPERLAQILDEWLWESPTELIPRDDQITQVLELLESRPDRQGPGVKNMIAECRRYLEI